MPTKGMEMDQLFRLSGRQFRSGKNCYEEKHHRPNSLVTPIFCTKGQRYKNYNNLCPAASRCEWMVSKSLTGPFVVSY